MRWFFVYNDILDYKMTKKIMGLQPCPTLLLPTSFDENPRKIGFF
jgi:hypothetical protein